MTKLLSVSDFAKLNGVSTQAVYARIQRGTLETEEIMVPQTMVVVPEKKKVKHS